MNASGYFDLIKDKKRADLSLYLKKYPLTDYSNKIEEFVEAGKELTTLCVESFATQIAQQVKNIEPYGFFHHDIRKMYLKWKTEMRKMFNSDKIRFREEVEMLEESDSVPPHPLIEELPDFPCDYGFDLLEKIQKETRANLGMLRGARSKTTIKLKDLTIDFVDSESVIILGGERCTLPPDGNELFLSRVMFAQPINTPIDWSIVYKEITGNDSSSQGKEKEKRVVWDTGRLVNRRISNFTGTEDKLFSWHDKSIIRNF